MHVVRLYAGLPDAAFGFDHLSPSGRSHRRMGFSAHFGFARLRRVPFTRWTAQAQAQAALRFFKAAESGDICTISHVRCSLSTQSTDVSAPSTDASTQSTHL